MSNNRNVCWACGESRLIWGGDEDLESITGEEGDAEIILTNLECHACGAYVEYRHGGGRFSKQDDDCKCAKASADGRKVKFCGTCKDPVIGNGKWTLRRSYDGTYTATLPDGSHPVVIEWPVLAEAMAGRAMGLGEILK